MVTRKAIKGVLSSFLGTYVSRYSDYDGYLLFGFLVGNLGELKINLLGQSVSDPNSPVGVAVLSAVAKFEDQRQKAGLVKSQLRDAWLTIRKLPGSELGFVNGHNCVGFKVCFSAEAVMDNGRRYERMRGLFVAPHDPKIESRSTRVVEPGAATDRPGRRGG